MPVGRPTGKRVRAWMPYILRFGLNKLRVIHRNHIYTLEFAEQLDRCADDNARALLLGVSK